MADQIIKNGVVVFPEWGPLRVDVRVRGGRVAEVGENLSPADGEAVFDASDRHVFPGFIDPHLHIGNYNSFVEDIATETIAAAAGGVTTILTYVKTLRHRDSEVSYKQILPEVIQQIRELSSVDVGLHLCMSTREHLQEIPDYLAAGCNSFKFYIGYRGNQLAMRRGSVAVTDGVILQGMRAVAAAGGGAKAGVHCENEEINQALMAEIPDKDGLSLLEWADTRPNFAEAEAVQRACFLARVSECPLYIVHLSSKEGLEVALKARRKSPAPVYIEANIHHLMLNRDIVSRLENPVLAKTTPPIREKASNEALWKAVADGSIDTIGTDHCAMKPERKQRGMLGSDPGFTGLDFYAPLVLTGAMERKVPLERVAQVCSLNSARLFHLPTKGSLRPGCDADFVVMNLNAPGVIDASKSLSDSRFTPYDGMKVTAKVETVALRGEVIFQNGRMLRERMGQPLHGF